VSFEPIEGAINDRIDEAYWLKYRDSRQVADWLNTHDVNQARD
jgi:hypothetical protein